jgi:hypothetical protein
LLTAALAHAERLDFFGPVERSLHLPMKTGTYSWLDKFKTLWASLLAGCDHRAQINQQLGAHEPAPAQLFGLPRFPDQSQVNRLLHAFRGYCYPLTVTDRYSRCLLACRGFPPPPKGLRRSSTGSFRSAQGDPLG